MAVTDDVIEKCIEIEAKLDFIGNLVENAKDPLWVEADADYSEFKSVADHHADDLAVLVGELQTLTGG